IMVDIEEEIANSEANFDFLRAMRIEQLYPFPEDALREELEKLSDLEEVVWVQEEPKNMCGRLYVVEYLRDIVPEDVSIKYSSRPIRSSTAVGKPNHHNKVEEAIKQTEGGNDSERN